MRDPQFIENINFNGYNSIVHGRRIFLPSGCTVAQDMKISLHSLVVLI
jgi:hypothetical protein